MARNNNKINLPTNTTDIRTMANYLRDIDTIGSVSKDKEQDVFADVKISKSKKKVTKPARDTHTKSTLKLFGLIDVSDDDSFSVSQLGKEVLNYFSSESSFSEEDRVALMLKVLCRWEIEDSYGRHMHPGYILIKLLCDSEMDYYITNQEFSHFSMSQNFLNDAQYNEIKAFILDFRKLELPYDRNLKVSKSDIFLSTFVTNWKILSKSSKKDTLTDKEYKSLLLQWKEDPIEDDSDSDDTIEVSADDKKTFAINEFRLNHLAAYISRIYLSLLEGEKVRDYLSYFSSTTKKINSIQTEQKENKSNSDCNSEHKEEYAENRIFFGAPGTGKSYEIAEKLKGRIDEKCLSKFVHRVTFHPEYDHASLVGGYKPYSNDDGEIEYKFVPQVFSNVFVKAVNDPDNQYYLVIEEINRGNCAEIFGELFQLLDRNKDYPINTSRELTEFLNGKDEQGKDVITNKTSEFWEINGKMLLPNNITLWATMNTSDQSLFPMDSAFKRRWDWEYIPINYNKEVSENASAEYTIVVDADTKINWIDFIKKINLKIESITNLGMDKCIGNYFVKPKHNNEISLDEFIHKVIFYLWNDVFKDEPKNSIFKDKISYQNFFPIKTAGEIQVKKIFENLDLIKPTETAKEISNEV
jgi:hypothetical protein